jgi:hypothetical protein
MDDNSNQTANGDNDTIGTTITRRRTISWAADVKEVREGGPKWGADEVPLLKDRVSSGGSDGEGGPSYTHVPRSNSTKDGSDNIVQPDAKSFATVSKIDASAASGTLSTAKSDIASTPNTSP